MNRAAIVTGKLLLYSSLLRRVNVAASYSESLLKTTSWFKPSALDDTWSTSYDQSTVDAQRVDLNHLTWTEALSCSLHSSHQTLWISSGCKRVFSHISRRWCSEPLPASPISRLKTVERWQGERERERVDMKRDSRLLVYVWVTDEIACACESPSNEKR